MEEDEFVISSWQHPDSQTELKEATEKHFINKKPSEKSSKENVENLNLWHDPEENRNMKFNKDVSEDEVSLDDDVLSRLIEGDLKNEEDALAKSRPKPKPRHKESSSTLRNDSADKLFSGKNEKSNVHHSETSPRPVPRPRAKPTLKENLSGSFSNKNNLGDSENSFKLSADKLFDSMGKGNKTVSFHDLSDKHDAVPKGEKKFGDIKHEGGSSLKENFGKKRSSETSEKKLKTPPTKPVRTKSKSLGDKKAHGNSGDEADTIDLKGSSHVPGQRRPPPRHPKDNFKQHNSPAHPSSKDTFEKQHNGPSHKQQYVSERELNSNGFTNGEDLRENFSFGQQEPAHGRNRMKNDSEDFNVKDQRFVERMGPRDDNVPVSSAEGNVSQTQYLGRGQNITAKHLNNQDFERSEHHGRLMNSRPSPRKRQDLGSSQKDFSKERNVTQTFEEHVPNTENVLGQNEQRNRRQGGRIEGKSKHTPLKAEKRLEEMTKSPELYDFHYDSRDTPQNLKFTSGNSGLSAKRSSSLTNIDDWRNTESDEDIDGLESWRSGFTSSTSIRQAVYNEWLERKQKGFKDKSKKKVEEKKKEEEKLKDKEERQLSAKKAFEAWSSSKEGAIKDQVKKKKEVKDKEIDEKREKVAKRKDAKKFFESWKSRKDEVLKESYKEKKTDEKDAKRKEIEDKQEKVDIAKKSYEKWKVRKDEQIKEEVKSKRRGDMLKTKYEKEAEKEKRLECERTFQEFMKKKGTWKRPPPSPTLTQRAWCPGGLTKGTNLIPDNLQPVIPTPRLNRSRSFSETSRTFR